MKPIPRGWSVQTVAAVTDRPIKLDPRETRREKVRYVDIGLIDGPVSHLADAPTVLSAEAPSRCRQLIATGDTLYSTVRPYLRKVALVSEELNGEFASTGYAVLRPTEGLHPAFLYYFTLSKDFEEQILPLQKGVSYPAVLDREVRAQRVWFPKMREQRRIVEILEDHLSRLDAANRELAKASARLERLDEAALARVLPSEGPSRPVVDLLEAPLSNGRSVPTREGGFPVLRLTALKDAGVDLAERKEGAWTRKDAARFLVQRGDFLIARGNGSLRLVGRGSLVRDEPDDIAFPDTVVRARPQTDLLLPDFLDVVWNARRTRDQIEAVSRTSAGIYKISQSQLNAIKLPSLPIEEQQEVVSTMRQIDDQRARSVQAFATARNRGDALRRAVLAAAFEGKLTGRHTDAEVIEERASV